MTGIVLFFRHNAYGSTQLGNKSLIELILINLPFCVWEYRGINRCVSMTKTVFILRSLIFSQYGSLACGCIMRNIGAHKVSLKCRGQKIGIKKDIPIL
jgi:hypothetical protein